MRRIGIGKCSVSRYAIGAFITSLRNSYLLLNELNFSDYDYENLNKNPCKKYVILIKNRIYEIKNNICIPNPHETTQLSILEFLENRSICLTQKHSNKSLQVARLWYL